MSGWPDPEKPGVPLKPKVTGEHYIGDSVALWYADLRKWAIIRGSRLQPPELLAGQCWAKYIGPCPTFVEVDTLRADLTHWQEVCYAHEAELQWVRAENARLREVLKIIAVGVDTFAINPSGLPDIVVEGGSRFAHERDVLPLIYAARAALAGEVKP